MSKVEINWLKDVGSEKGKLIKIKRQQQKSEDVMGMKTKATREKENVKEKCEM